MTYTIAIVDSDSYFVLGLKALLSNHFSQKGISVCFVPERAFRNAKLLFISSSAKNSMQFCQNDNQQRVIIVKSLFYRSGRYKRPCQSEVGMIERHVEVNRLLRQVVSMLAQPLVNLSMGKYLRCAEKLTLREYQVLSALKLGQKGERIAIQLNLSSKTVSAHKCNAMRKLGFIRNQQLYFWLQNGGLEVR